MYYQEFEYVVRHGAFMAGFHDVHDALKCARSRVYLPATPEVIQQTIDRLHSDNVITWTYGFEHVTVEYYPPLICGPCRVHVVNDQDAGM